MLLLDTPHLGAISGLEVPLKLDDHSVVEEDVGGIVSLHPVGQAAFLVRILDLPGGEVGHDRSFELATGHV